MQAQELARQGWRFLRDGKASEAWRTCQELLKTAPDLEATRYLASKTALQIGNARLALEHADAALAVSGKAALHLQRAQCLLVLGDRDATRAAVDQAVTIANKDVAILVVAGSILNKCEDVVAALAIFRQAQQLEPENDSVLFNLATSLRFLGELDEAEEVINRVIESCPDNHQSVLFRADLRKQTPDDNHVEDLERRIVNGANDWKGEMNLFYALAKEAEDIGSYEKSYQALSRGSTVRRRHLDYDVLRDVAVLDDIRDHYAEQASCSGDDGFAAAGPVFIVGMPRTGTTLVERILAGHSEVTSAGELHDFSSELVKEISRVNSGKPVAKGDIVAASLQIDFARLGENYVAAARQAIDGSSAYVIDKLPFNFLYCGLIHRALPEAKIIHMTRAPMDTCYAVYKTLFGQAYQFSYDLDEPATYYIAYRKLMDHWHAVLPGLIHDVAYEDVVADTEDQARRLIKHCGLEWEPGCLDFHTSKQASTTASAVQVRQPIYLTSVQKWRNYEEQLAPLEARLRDAGLLDLANESSD